MFYQPVVHAFKCVPVTKEKKRSAALQSMVGSKVMVLIFYRPVVHAFKQVCARDEGEEAVCSAVEHGWKQEQGHGSHVLSACGPCI